MACQKQKKRGGEKAKRKVNSLLWHFQHFFEFLPSEHALISEVDILHLEGAMIKATKCSTSFYNQTVNRKQLVMFKCSVKCQSHLNKAEI